MSIWWWIFKTELLTRCRQSQAWAYPLGFFLIIVSLFPIAFSPDPDFLKKYTAGMVWIAALLASLLSSENLFHADLEDGHIEQLLISPNSLTFMLSAKLLAHWCLTQLPLVLLSPVIGIFFHLSIMETVILATTLLVGTPILTLIGALGVSLTIGLKQQGILLGLLILPLVAPVIIFAVSVMQQTNLSQAVSIPLSLLSGLSILAITFLPTVIAVTLRISLDN